jgi:hypothetical protein
MLPSYDDYNVDQDKEDEVADEAADQIDETMIIVSCHSPWSILLKHISSGIVRAIEASGDRDQHQKLCTPALTPQESGEPQGVQRTGRAAKPNAVRVTTPYMTKYERARVLGTRALQIRYVVLIWCLSAVFSFVPLSNFEEPADNQYERPGPRARRGRDGSPRNRTQRARR